MSYRFFDWRYVLPCESRISKEVRDSLPPWLLGLHSHDLDGVQAVLRKRWGRLPIPLVPLRNRILEGGKPAIVGLQGRAFLEMTLGGQGPDEDWPWIPRVWSKLTNFLPDKARAWLAQEGVSSTAELARMTDESVHFLAYSHLSPEPLMHHYRGDEESQEWTVYVRPPTDPSSIKVHLEKRGFKTSGLLASFIRAFDGLRESEPGNAGGFIPAGDWVTVEGDRRSDHSWVGHLSADEVREWKDAVILFYARNADQVLLHPSGRLAWFFHAENRIEAKWPTFQAFASEYADALEFRFPFDAYGASDEAIEARRRRESGSGGSKKGR